MVWIAWGSLSWSFSPIPCCNRKSAAGIFASKIIKGRPQCTKTDPVYHSTHIFAFVTRHQCHEHCSTHFDLNVTLRCSLRAALILSIMLRVTTFLPCEDLARNINAAIRFYHRLSNDQSPSKSRRPDFDSSIDAIDRPDLSQNRIASDHIEIVARAPVEVLGIG